VTYERRAGIWPARRVFGALFLGCLIGFVVVVDDVDLDGDGDVDIDGRR
jgi:hypothetical protein